MVISILSSKIQVHNHWSLKNSFSMQLSIWSILAKPWLKLVVIFYFLYLHWIIAKRS